MVLPGGVAKAWTGEFAVFGNQEWLVGGASVPVASDPSEVSLGLYRDLLAAATDWNLARIWNYVPAINEPGPDGLENYRAFSQGRSLAFEERFGPDFARYVPAASAVGTQADRLTVVFAATRKNVRYVENALQTPAYDYPADYGPRSPTFARAAMAGSPPTPSTFVSGTASVRGHATVAAHDTMAQLDCTLENLREIVASLEPDSPVHERENGNRVTRFFKVYLRHKSELPAVAAELEQRLLHPGDIVHYLWADICRADLNVEIEFSTCSDQVLAV